MQWLGNFCPSKLAMLLVNPKPSLPTRPSIFRKTSPCSIDPLSFVVLLNDWIALEQ